MKRIEFETKWSEVTNLNGVLETLSKDTYEETMNSTLGLLLAYGRAYIFSSESERVICQTMQEFITDFRSVLRSERYSYVN